MKAISLIIAREILDKKLEGEQKVELQSTIPDNFVTFYPADKVKSAKKDISSNSTALVKWLIALKILDEFHLNLIESVHFLFGNGILFNKLLHKLYGVK